MIGITDVIDRNATFSVRKPIVYTRIAKDSSETLNKHPNAKNDTSILKNLWHRHLATIIAGATRFGDRLQAGRIWTTDLCGHPQCNSARCDAGQSNYCCHNNKANIDLAQAARQKLLDEINANSYHGSVDNNITFKWVPSHLDEKEKRH